MQTKANFSQQGLFEVFIYLKCLRKHCFLLLFGISLALLSLLYLNATKLEREENTHSMEFTQQVDKPSIRSLPIIRKFLSGIDSSKHKWPKPKFKWCPSGKN